MMFSKNKNKAPNNGIDASVEFCEDRKIKIAFNAATPGDDLILQILKNYFQRHGSEVVCWEGFLELEVPTKYYLELEGDPFVWSRKQVQDYLAENLNAVEAIFVSALIDKVIRIDKVYDFLFNFGYFDVSKNAGQLLAAIARESAIHHLKRPRMEDGQIEMLLNEKPDSSPNSNKKEL